MIAPTDNSSQGAPSTPVKTVKAIPSSPIYAMFDIVEFEGKQLVQGQIGFMDQFGMERTAKTGTDLGVLNLGKHILAIFQGQVDIAEPDEETKKQLAANLEAEALETKTKILNAYQESAKSKVEMPNNPEPGAGSK